MGEEEKDKERTIEKEPELLEEIKSIRQQIEEDGQSNVRHVDERYSNNIGYFTYTQNGKKMMSNIMMVNVIDEQKKRGLNIVYVQGKNGKLSKIASETYDIENPSNRSMRINERNRIR